MSETLKTGGEKSAKSAGATHLEVLTKMSDKFDDEIARKTQVAASTYRKSALVEDFLPSAQMGHLNEYKGGLNEIIKIEMKTKGSSYESILNNKRGDLTILEHTARILNVFDNTFAQPLYNAGVSDVSTVAREALKVRDIYRYVGVAEADSFMRNIDGMAPSLGRSYILEVLSGEDLARTAFAEDADASKKDEFRNWGKRIDEEYGVGVLDQESSPTANLTKMITDTVDKEIKSRKKN